MTVMTMNCISYIHAADGTPQGENDIDDIAEAYDGRMWLRSHTTYYVYNPLTDRIEHNADSLFHSYGGEGYVRMVRADKNKGLWMYVIGPSGIFISTPRVAKSVKSIQEVIMNWIPTKWLILPRPLTGWPS